MMGQMKFFPAFYSYRRTLSGMSELQVGRVFLAALQYAEEGSVPELDPIETLGFRFIKEDIDRARDHYDSVCERRREAINKRWSSRNEDANDTKVYNSIEMNTIDSKEKAKANETENEKEKENAIATATTTDAGGARVVGGGGEKKNGFDVPSISDVAGYCVKQGYTHVDVEEFVKFYDDNGWTVSDGEPIKSWKAVLRGWEERARKKPKPSAPAASSFDTDDFFDAALQRTYGENWRFFKDAGG